MRKTSYIAKENGKYCVKSEKNSDWSGGCYDSRSAAEKRLKEVEAIKHMKKDDSDDGAIKSMSKQLNDIATYLEEAGLISDAKQMKNLSYVLDAASDNDTFYVVDAVADYIPEEQSNVENQGYIGGDGTAGGYSMFNVPESARVAARLLQIASDLDEKGRYEEATELDDIVREYTEEEEDALKNMPPEPELTDEELEEMAEYYSESDEAMDGLDDLVRSNGLRGNTPIDDQNSAMTQGFSDAYMYTGYGQLEGRYGPQ